MPIYLPCLIQCLSIILEGVTNSIDSAGMVCGWKKHPEVSKISFVVYGCLSLQPYNSMKHSFFNFCFDQDRLFPCVKADIIYIFIHFHAWQRSQHSQKSNPNFLDLLSTQWPHEIHQAMILPTEICIWLIQKLISIYSAVLCKTILNIIYILAAAN